ncbi:MAG: ribonuclease III family protein [Candidatus Bathyarchaeia archaeon]
MSKDSVLKEYKNLEEVLLDKDLAGLGDAYVNLLYSLVVSQKSGHPTGAKVNNKILAEAVRKAGLRELLPHRIDRHVLGNAAEALIAFAWLTDTLTFQDSLKILGENDDNVEAFTILLREILERLGNHDEQK